MRQATRADVAGMQRVRGAVLENRLVSRVITDDEVIEAIETTGRGWVVKVGDEIVAFAIGDARDGNIWALFVDPAHERCGHGRRLHDVMIAWLGAKGLRELWLTTEPDTRAAGFYERAGWRRDGVTPGGEIRFVRTMA